MVGRSNQGGDKKAIAFVMRRRDHVTITALLCSHDSGANPRAGMSSCLPLTYWKLDGEDLRREPFETRKATLAS